MPPRRRYQRGALRLEGRQWVLTLRAEPDAPGEPRTSLRLRVGLRSELRTRSAARLEADRLLALLEHSTRPIGSRLRFGCYAPEYFARYVDGMVRPHTAAQFRCRLNKHLMPHLRDIWLEDITTNRVQDLVAELGRAGLATATARACIALLRRMLKAATAEGLAARPIPAQALRYARQRHIRPAARCFDDVETAAILTHCTGRHRLLYAILAHAGLRVSEALGLHWKHVDLTRNELLIRGASTRGKLFAPKSQASCADVPISDQLREEFDRYLHEQPPPNPELLVFCHPTGATWQADHVRTRHLQPLLNTLGIPRGGMHAFRHGLATRLFAHGVGAPTVQSILRHSTLRQTMEYAHTNQTLIRDALMRSTISYSPAAAQRCGDGVAVETTKQGSP